MSFRLFERVATLVKADAHGVVDALEEHSLVLKQSLREAELELVQKRARVEALDEEERRLSEELGHVEREIASLDEDVTLALRGEKVELARFAIRRLLPRRKAGEQLRDQIAELVDSRQRLSQRLEEQERAHQELRARARARLATLRKRGVSEGALEELLGGEAAVADEEVEIELLRRQAATEGGA